MAQQSEAACLLENGAMYGKRLLLQPRSGDPIFAGFRPGVFSLYFGDAPIYHFDLEGRWQRAFVAGTHYLKGLDATVQAIDRIRQGENLVLKRRTLGYAESSDLDAQVRAAALDVLGALNAERLDAVPPPPPTPSLAVDELRDALERITSWDAAAWFAHRERYLAAYGPIPVLPPDAQGAVVLQATLGQAGGVAFGLGAAAEHAVRTPGEFAAHVGDVRRLLGRRILQCRRLFLAGSDALRQGPASVSAYLETIASVFPINPELRPARPKARIGSEIDAEPYLEGIAAFLDDFAPPRPDRPAWQRFRAQHLRRVSLGIESGDPDVRALYCKTWTNEDVRALAAELKDSGLGVGVLVLVDAGGDENARRHLDATAELINALPLGPGDLVSLLDGNEVRDPMLGPDDLDFTPLTGPRWAEQQAELRRLLDPVRTARGAKVAPYTLEKQSS
jgi:hypothetical protein